MCHLLAGKSATLLTAGITMSYSKGLKSETSIQVFISKKMY